MRPNIAIGSVARTTDLKQEGYELSRVERGAWRTGDLVVGRVTQARGPLARVELTNGRMAELVEGDLVLGALGVRHATLEAVGSWEAVGDDLRMHMLTSAGLLGRCTSLSRWLPGLVSLDYEGHATRHGERLDLAGFVPSSPPASFAHPTILIIGTSMSAGKTTAAKAVIRSLKRLGRETVVGCKLTGAGRYRDILSMGDAGADAIHDFVDVGLPSSILPPEEFRAPLRTLLGIVAAHEPDVVVAEAGASPVEPYNGEVVMEEIRAHVRMTILCASDPYAVIGVMKGFDLTPDLVAGRATSTRAGVEVVQRLCEVEALELGAPEARERLDALLSKI